MTLITKSKAQKLRRNYTNFGTPNDFTMDNGSKITGYIFSKSEFVKLLKKQDEDSFYIMLGRTNKDDEIDSFITPIIGRIKENGDIDEEDLIYCENPYFGTPIWNEISIDDQLIETKNHLSKNDLFALGDVIDPRDAKRMIDHHLVYSKPLNLTLPDYNRVIGFTLSNLDIRYLLAGDEPDRLLIIPALLDIDETRKDVIPDRLTLIFTWLKNDDSLYTIKMRDYCVPCPNGCHSFN